MKTSRILVLALLIFAIGTMALAHEHPITSEHPKEAENAVKAGNCVEVAASAGDFVTLVEAIEAAGLTETLQADGPFTIFAPTDEAFAKLPEGTFDDLLLPANKAKLAGILANHVVPGKIMAADMKSMKATNVSGLDLIIKVDKDHVTVDGVTVVKADINATNGVIHAIDTVMIPTATGEMPATAAPKDHPAH